jgi:RNA polymerase sigma-70 factor (ECF subfamily)
MNPGKHVHSPVDPSCLKVFEKLSEYLDGELSPQDCLHIQEHIQDCAPCVAFVESLKNSIQAVRKLGPGESAGEVPTEVSDKLKAAWQAALERRGKK